MVTLVILPIAIPVGIAFAALLLGAFGKDRNRNAASSPASATPAPEPTSTDIALAADSAREAGDHELANELDARMVDTSNHETMVETQLSALPPEHREAAESALTNTDPANLVEMRQTSQAIAPVAPHVAQAIESQIASVATSVEAPVAPAPTSNDGANAIASPTPDVAPVAPTPAPTPSDVVAPPPVSPASPTPAPLAVPTNASAQEIEAAVDAQLGTNAQPAPAPAPTVDANREQARNLAPLISEDIRTRSYSYNRQRIRDFQTLMGLNVDGLYGPTTRQALIDLGVNDAPRALFRG